MRVATSIIVSSLLFGSLAINSQTVHTRISGLMMAKIDSPQLLAEQTKPSPNQPQNPNRHRGSGRKGLDASFGSINSMV
jgi:hypothetical protein